MSYYVYAFLREDGTPYYIGKGSNERCYDTHGRGCRRPSDINRIKKLHENLTEEEAFSLEKKYIAEYGRKDTGSGILYNHSDGGEGTSGASWHYEDKSRYVGESNPFYGRKHSPETIAKIKAARAKQKCPRKGTKHSDESKALMSAAKKGRKLTEEHKANIKANHASRRS